MYRRRCFVTILNALLRQQGRKALAIVAVVGVERAPDQIAGVQSYGCFPRRQKFLLGDRIQGTALDILESLVEATYTRERESHLARANLGIEKLRFLVRLALDLGYLDPRRYKHAARALDETGRKVGAWRKTHRARSGG